MVEVEEDDVGWRAFLRVRILLDLYKPLARERTIELNGLKYRIPTQYEKLPRFYFTCGIIMHANEVCVESNQRKEVPPQFGSWMRAVVDGRRQCTQSIGRSSTVEKHD